MKYDNVSKLDLTNKLPYNNQDAISSLPLSIRRSELPVQDSRDIEPGIPIFDTNNKTNNDKYMNYNKQGDTNILKNIPNKYGIVYKHKIPNEHMELVFIPNDTRDLKQGSNVIIEVPRSEVVHSAISNVFTYFSQKPCGRKFNFHKLNKKLGHKLKISNDTLSHAKLIPSNMSKDKEVKNDPNKYKSIHRHKKSLDNKKHKVESSPIKSLMNTSNVSSLNHSLVATLNNTPLRLFQGNKTTANKSRLHIHLPKLKENTLLKKIKSKFEKCNGKMSYSIENKKSYFSESHNSYTRTNSKEKAKLKLFEKSAKLKELNDKQIKVKLRDNKMSHEAIMTKQSIPTKVVNDYTKIAIKSLLKPKALPYSIEYERVDKNRERDRLEMQTLLKSHWTNKGTELKTELSFYKIGKILGRGAFGKVNLAIHKLSGKFVAIKSINKKVMTDEKSKLRVLREVSIWNQLQHKNIIRLYETFESQDYLHYVEEFCAGGDLLTYVRRRKKLKEPIAKYILKQILDALHYCHSKSILHRDIKLDNILIADEGVVKVGLIMMSRYVILV